MGERHAWSTPRHFSDITQNLLLPRSILSRPHAVTAQHHISKTVNIPAVHMLTRITVKKQLPQTSAKGKVRQERSNERMKRRRRSAPEKVDLSSVCSECCHSCIWFSRTQVTSRGVISTGREDSAEGKGLCLHQNTAAQPPPVQYLLSLGY